MTIVRSRKNVGIAIELASKTKEYISKGWCQGNGALNELGANVTPASEEACSFCLVGGAVRSSMEKHAMLFPEKDTRGSIFSWDPYFILLNAFDDAALLNGSAQCVAFNDAPGRKQEEVVMLIDETIAILQEEYKTLDNAETL